MMISEKFTIEDIHQIRYTNYQQTKHLSHHELIEKTNKQAQKILKRLEKIKTNQAK